MMLFKFSFDLKIFKPQHMYRSTLRDLETVMRFDIGKTFTAQWKWLALLLLAVAVKRRQSWRLLRPPLLHFPRVCHFFGEYLVRRNNS